MTKAVQGGKLLETRRSGGLMKLYDKLPLKKAYYRIFTGMIVIPLLLVFGVALVALGKQYKEQAIENIRGVQQGVAGEIQSDVDFMSMRLSQLTNVNDNMVIQYVVEMDNADATTRYDAQKKLDQAGNMVIEPVKDVVSIGFYMKSGNQIFLKSNIKRSNSEIRECQWYQDALLEPNSVKIGSYQTIGASDLYLGGGKDQLVLIYALSPNVMIDRSQSVEMVVLYQTTDAGNSIRNYNRYYNRRNNKLGIMQIVDENGNPIYKTEEIEGENAGGYTCVRTPVELENATWYIESYIKTSELMQDFMKIAIVILLVAALIFALAGYFAGYFIRQIVNPIGELSDGLKQIEDGKMDIHITPQGQAEIRGVIHHFNAMARSLKSLIADYEEQVRKTEKSNGEYFTAMIRGEMSPAQVAGEHPEFFSDSYVLVGLYFEWAPGVKADAELIRQVLSGFERNPRYTLHCVACPEGLTKAFLYYRITENDDGQRMLSMLKELQSYVKTEYNAEMECCIGRKCENMDAFEEAVMFLREYAGIRYLYGEAAIVDLEEKRTEAETLRNAAKEYGRLADTLYGADAKNFTAEKEKLYEKLNTGDRQEAEEAVFAVIIAIASRFGTDGITLSEIFSQRYNYKEKVGRLEDVRSMKMWITNYINWVMDYSVGKIDAIETNVIVKAKRYLADHYDDAELTLSQVAEHVGLSEKYFTNRFTKETGETFSNYLTQLRIQKAKELLRTTTFKSYEIGEMVGYRNAEHFTRMFKKEAGCTPAQYRKQGE